MIFILLLNCFLYYPLSCTAPSINSPCHLSHQKIDGDIAVQHHSSRRIKRGATLVRKLLWPHGIIPYSISSSFSRSVSQNIKSAMKVWEENTCLRFKPLSNESYGLKFEPQECGCCSFVGRQLFANNKPQEISINGEDCADIGHMLHEIGHAIGFWHEHVRPDRNRYVRVKETNIDPDSIHNFERKNRTEINSLGERYDYDSIMHYSSRSFAMHKSRKTLVPIQKYMTIGQRNNLSVGDIRQANKLYTCVKDKNQCLVNNGGCDHTCIDLYQGFKCGCREGFILGLDKSSCVLACIDWFEEAEGLIFSPNYPMKYTADVSCLWEIRAPPGFFIKLQLLKFALENSSQCTFDALSVRRLINYVWEDVALFCGKTFTRKIVIRSNTARIIFRSDAAIQEKGFKIFYQFQRSVCVQRPWLCHPQPPFRQRYHLIPPSTQNCDNEFVVGSGDIHIPSHRPITCNIKIHSRKSGMVTIHLRDINMSETPQCEEEHLTVRKGRKQADVARICGVMQSQVLRISSKLVILEITLQREASEFRLQYDTV